MKRLFAFVAAVVILVCVAVAFAQEKPAVATAKEVVSSWTFFRQYYVLMGPVIRNGADLEPIKLNAGKAETAQWINMDTPLPPSGWQKFDFNDGYWNRKPVSDPDSPWMGLICYRGRFNVSDPAAVKSLNLSLAYRGGLAVFLNGKEIARGNLKAGAAPKDLADDYTDEDFKNRRTLNIPVASADLRKGVNVLALEVHRAAQLPSTAVFTPGKEAEMNYGTCGLMSLSLTCAPDDPIPVNIARPEGFQVWNSDTMNGDLVGDWGDPSEVLQAIRIVAPRAGAASGKVVAGSKGILKGLVGSITDFTQKSGPGKIPASLVQVRYSRPSTGGSEQEYGIGNGPFDKLDALEEVPMAEIPVSVPRQGTWPDRVIRGGAMSAVWVTVNVPADAKPGDYLAKLTVSASGQNPVEVPVELKVCPWTCPAPKDFPTVVDIMESPESVAMAWNVPLWSDEHLKLVGKSFKLLSEVGSCVAYVPLICDTNMGNDETMVRWIKQPDGSYKYDFSVMEKYLDTVEKYQGKPRIVCFNVWDTYLEGGTSGGEIQDAQVMKERLEHKGKGPIVSMLDPVTGKVEKGDLPMHSDPASEALWAPVMKEIRERLKKRGLEDAEMIGIMTDQLPTIEVGKLFDKIAPGVKWVRASHDAYQKKIGVMPVGYSTVPYLWNGRLFAQDPSVQRSHGWLNPNMETHFPRNIYDSFPMTQWRFQAEMNAAGEMRGFSRIGGDFFSVLKNAKGQHVGSLSGRFPKSFWRMLTIQTAVLSKGKDSPIGGGRLEMIREGLQETSARIYLDKVLLDDAQKARLGPDLAKKAQDLLDLRTRDMRRAVSTLKAVGIGNRKVLGMAYGDAWYFHPAVFGDFWYISYDWQVQAARLYDLAAEVEAKLK